MDRPRRRWAPLCVAGGVVSAAFDVPLEALTGPGVRRARPRVLSVKRLAKRDLRAGAAEFPEQPGVDYQRPRTLAECDSVGLGTVTPCPFVSCKHHLALDVNDRTGSIKRNFPDLEVWEMHATCALTVAAEGGTTLDGVAAAMNVTRERVRQVETKALRALRVEADRRGITVEDCPDDGDSRVTGSSGRHVSTPKGFPSDPVRARAVRR